MSDLIACVQSNMRDLILADFNLAVDSSICQTAKFSACTVWVDTREQLHIQYIGDQHEHKLLCIDIQYGHWSCQNLSPWSVWACPRQWSLFVASSQCSTYSVVEQRVLVIKMRLHSGWVCNFHSYKLYGTEPQSHASGTYTSVECGFTDHHSTIHTPVLVTSSVIIVNHTSHFDSTRHAGDE